MAKKKAILKKTNKASVAAKAAGRRAIAKEPTARAKPASIKRPARKVAGKPGNAAAANKAIATQNIADPKRAHKLTADEKKKFRGLLIRIRAHITGQINFLSKDNLSRSKDDTDLDFRSEEQGTDNFDRDLALSRVSMEQNALFEIDEALNRLDTGAYGTCGDCGKLIEQGRLAVMPHSRLCVTCQSEAETGFKKARTASSSVFRDNETVTADTETEEE